MNLYDPIDRAAENTLAGTLALPRTRRAIATLLISASVLPVASAADRYWSGNGGSDNIDQGGNWYGNSNPSPGDNLYFNNTITRHQPYSNYGAGSYFGAIVSYNGAGGIKWRGDKTYLFKFENFNDGNLLEAEATLSSRTGPDSDLEINPVGAGGVKVNNVEMQNGKQLKVYGSNTLTVAGSISQTGSGNASVALLGSATVILNQGSIYAGGTTVSGGKLIVNNSSDSATGTGAVTVASGATLAGVGIVGGSTTIQSGGIHAPGTAVGVIRHSDLTYRSGSIFAWDISSSVTTGRGADYDGINVSGSLGGESGASGNAIFRIVLQGAETFADPFWNATRTWDDIFKTSNGGGAISDWVSVFGGGFQYRNSSGTLGNPIGEGAFSLSGNTLTWTAVPEPANAIVGLLVGWGMFLRRRPPEIK